MIAVHSLGKLKKLVVLLLEISVLSIMALLVVDVVWGVVSRYVLGNQAKWTEELANILLVWVGFLGASVAFIRHGHLGVDYFVGKLSGRARHAVDLLVSGCVIFFAAAVMVFGGGSRVVALLGAEFPKHTPALQINEGYCYLVLPLSGLIIVLASIGDMAYKLQIVLRGEKKKAPDEQTALGTAKSA